MPDMTGMPFRLDGETQDDSFEEDEDLDEDTELTDEDKQKIEDGEVCANCGGEFEKNQGTPSMCHDCWKISTEEERTGFTESNSDVLTL